MDPDLSRIAWLSSPVLIADGEWVVPPLMLKFLLSLSVVSGFLLSATIAPAEKAAPPWGEWPTWGDQGDGTYRNPVLPSDYSDIDCIRVGSVYYAISSTFQFSPGMVILRSSDLVNWTIAGHAIADLRQIGPDLNWDKMNRYGKGVWAGALRYYQERFWIYFGTPDEGYFMTTAKDPSGPWEPLHPVLKARGWDDCCPFWDDDGQGYLVGTNFSDHYKIHLFKLSADSRDLAPNFDRVIHQSRGSEANKLYKINGLYYHLFSEVKPEGRVLMMRRAQSIEGPYEEPRQLNHAERGAMDPNQGGLLQSEAGKWYFFTHHGRGSWEGRCNSLLPVTWKEGWPIIGQVGEDGIGHMVWSGKKPVPNTPIVTPQTNDDFDSATLPSQWEWNYQPRAEKWSLVEHPGWLRLHAFNPLENDNLLKAGNTLTQRCFRTSDNEVTVKLDLSGMADGQKAGLCHFAKTRPFLGIAQEDGSRFIEYQQNGDKEKGPKIDGLTIWLRSTWGLEGVSQYSFSLDGKTFTDTGKPYPLSWGSYRGDRIGLFSYNNLGEAGYVDVDFFHYRYAPEK